MIKEKRGALSMKIYVADISVLRKRTVFSRLYEGMSEARRQRIDRFRFPKDRCRSLGAGVLLRKALTDAGVDETVFVYGEHGKPRLAGDPGVHFNLSHAGDRAMCVISTHRVGCDVERIGRRGTEVAERFFAPEEYERIQAAPESERGELFTRFWALKESFLKVTGLGLTLPLGAFAIDLGDEAVTIRQNVDGNSYRFFELATGDEYRYAVCEQNGDGAPPTVEWVDLEKC